MSKICVGVDIGSDSIKLVKTIKQKSGAKPQVTKSVTVPSRGFRSGQIIDYTEALASLKHAFHKIREEKKSSEDIDCIHLAIGGNSLSAKTIRVFGKNLSEEEVQENDIKRMEEKAEVEFMTRYPNKKILHLIPLRYFLDDEILGTPPIGMFGEKLGVDVFFISVQEQIYESILSLFSEIGVTIDAVIASPLAESIASLRYRQRVQGVSIVNMGAETTTVSLFKNGSIQFLRVHPLGSNHITNDIALGLQVSLEEAEKIKRGGQTDFSKRKIEGIMYARLEDIIDVVKKDLRQGRKMKYIPAGIVLTGAGSQLPFTETYFKEITGYPVDRIKIYKNPLGAKKGGLIGIEYTAAYGACFDFGEKKKRRKKVSIKSLWRGILRFLNQIKP